MAWSIEAIKGQFDQFVDDLKITGYSENTLKIKKKVLKAFIRECEINKLSQVDFTDITKIFSEIKSRISQSYKAHVSAIEHQIKCWLLELPRNDLIQQLKDYSQLPEKDWLLVNQYILYLLDLKTSPMAIRRTIRIVIRFLRWLLSQNKEFTEISFATFEKYLERNQQIQAPHSISAILTHIKRFYKWCYITSKTRKPLFDLIPSGIKTRYVPSPHIWTKEEINLLLKTVLLNGTIGIRDFAILMLAIRLSIRSVDIANIKLDDIDWKTGELKFVQQKTKKVNSFILPKDVAWALINYIKVRPKIDSRILFITNRAPFRPFSFSVSGIIFPYLKRAGIPYGKNLPSKGLHSLRHTLATLMLSEEIPLTIISSVLGHSDIESSKAYIKEDIEHLRLCCIDLERELLNE